MKKPNVIHHAGWRIAAVIILALAASFAVAPQACAQVLANTCSYNPEFNIPLPASGTGIITTLVNNINLILGNIAYSLYTTILADSGFQGVLNIAIVLYIAIYGILFTIGMVQVTIMDFLIRIVKMGIIAMLISPASWSFFNQFVVTFFLGGLNWLVGIMVQIAVGTAPNIDPNTPFAVLDNAVSILTSSKMAVTLIATFFTGPYGMIFGLMIIAGLGTFIASLFQAMLVYLMALVVLAFLFAIAPLFFGFMLFSRTRHLFDGWINQMVNAVLQPVFLFTFFAFFSKLIEAALWNLLRVPVCWTPADGIWRGTPFDVHMWRFMREISPGSNTWEMYGGAWSFTGADFPGAPVFPLGIIDILIFLLLVQLAWRFNNVVMKLASDIAGASFSLNLSPGGMTQLGSKFGEMVTGSKDKGKKSAKKTEGGKTGTDAPKGGLETKRGTPGSSP